MRSPNHIHLIIDTRGELPQKKVEVIRANPQESKKEWMIWMFERAGKKTN